MRRLSRIAAIAGVLVLVGGLASAGAANAITPTIAEYSAGLNAGSIPGGIAAGPDGSLWFTDGGSTPAIGRITPAGQISEFSAGLNAGSSPTQIAPGPDGNLWFTDTGTTKAIGRINPLTQAIDEFSLNPSSFPQGIAAGPDGNVWFADTGARAIGRINPTTHVFDEFSVGLNANSSPARIAAGPDGNLWFADQGTTKAIGRINPATQAITEFSAGLSTTSSPQGITAGPDDNLWFADRDGSSARAIGRITPAGQISEFSAGLNPGGRPRAIAAGPDGHLWFADEGPTPAIGRIDPTTQTIGEFSLNPGSFPREIAAGTDGNLWFTDSGTTTAIGRITTPPAAGTTSATGTGPTSATVAGTANGHAQATSFHIEYGRVGAATTTTPEQNLGTTSADTPISVTLRGLTPSTAYRARVVVTNPTDTTAGAFLTFTTPADRTPPSCSVAVPKQKLGAVIRKGLRTFVRCSEGATIKSLLLLPASLAQRFHTARLVGRGTGRLAQTGRVEVDVKLTRKAKRAFRHVLELRLTLQTMAADLAGNRAPAIRRKLTLRR